MKLSRGNIYSWKCKNVIQILNLKCKGSIKIQYIDSKRERREEKSSKRENKERDFSSSSSFPSNSNWLVVGRRKRRRRRIITIVNFLPDSLLVFKLISKREGKFRSRSKPRNKFVAFRKSVSESESTFATWCKEALSVVHGRKYEGVRQAERKVSSSKRVFSTRARVGTVNSARPARETFETCEWTRSGRRRGRWKSFGRRWWADYYAIRAIVIQLLHSVTPVFAPRNYAWIRDARKQRAGRLLRRAKFNPYANDRPFNTFSNSICVHAPRVVARQALENTAYRSLRPTVFVPRFYGSRIGKPEGGERVFAEVDVWPWQELFTVPRAYYIWGGTFGDFSSLRNEIYIRDWIDLCDRYVFAF